MEHQYYEATSPRIPCLCVSVAHRGEEDNPHRKNPWTVYRGKCSFSAAKHLDLRRIAVRRAAKECALGLRLGGSHNRVAKPPSETQLFGMTEPFGTQYGDAPPAARNANGFPCQDRGRAEAESDTTVAVVARREVPQAPRRRAKTLRFDRAGVAAPQGSRALVRSREGRCGPRHHHQPTAAKRLARPLQRTRGL